MSTSISCKYGSSLSLGKTGAKIVHILWKLGEETLRYLDIYLHYVGFLSFHRKFSRWPRSLDCIYILQLEILACNVTLPTPVIISYIFVLLSPTDSFKNAVECVKKDKVSRNRLRLGRSPDLLSAADWKNLIHSLDRHITSNAPPEKNSELQSSANSTWFCWPKFYYRMTHCI